MVIEIFSSICDVICFFLWSGVQLITGLMVVLLIAGVLILYNGIQLPKEVVLFVEGLLSV